MDHFFFKSVFGNSLKEDDLGDFKIAGIFFLEPLTSVYFKVQRVYSVGLRGLLEL